MGPLGRLHIITDSLAIARAALSAGAPVIQVRVEDSVTDRQAYDLIVRVAALCAEYGGATCLVNDRLHVALAAGVGSAGVGSAAGGASAAGVAGGHVGADDLPVEAARRILGPAAILGATARSPDTALAAVAAGASYLGVGPAYATSTKQGLPAPIGCAGVAAVAAAVAVPVIAIGGITVARVPELLAAGAYGVAVVGAVSSAADPAAATAAFLTALAAPPPAPPAPPAPAPSRVDHEVGDAKRPIRHDLPHDQPSMAGGAG